MLPPISSRASNSDHMTCGTKCACRLCIDNELSQWGREAGPNPTGSGHRQYGTSGITMSTAMSITGVTRHCRVSYQWCLKHGGAGTPRGKQQGTASQGESLPGAIPLLSIGLNWSMEHLLIWFKSLWVFEESFDFPLKIQCSERFKVNYDDEVLEEPRYFKILILSFNQCFFD